MDAIKPFAFVLMPFSSDFDDIYKLGIKAACERAGFVAERVDEQTFSETILDRILRQIGSADVIIADMSGKNPNVFYEVGYAHALSKPCTLLTQSSEDIPFDLKHHRHIIYGSSIERLGSRLEVELKWRLENFRQSAAKQISVDVRNIIGHLRNENWRHRAEVEMRIDIKNVSGQKIEDIEAIYLHTGEGWGYSEGDKKCASTESDLEKYALKHFLGVPLSTLSPGAWAPLDLIGLKTLAYRSKGDELKDRYHLSGHVTLEIVTGSGTFRERFVVDAIVDEIPF